MKKKVTHKKVVSKIIKKIVKIPLKIKKTVLPLKITVEVEAAKVAKAHKAAQLDYLK